MIQIREYGRITSDSSKDSSLDLGVVSQATFDWLLSLKASWRSKDNPIQVVNKSYIKLDSYVGYLESPAGESIEILPKTSIETHSNDEVKSGRRLLHRMLLRTHGIKPREAGNAHLRRVDQPVHEWIMGKFLEELARLVRKGIRSDYRNVEEESRFIRGRLDMTRQLRQRPDRACWFHIRHDVFSPDTIENRLLATALSYVRRVVKSPDNWRLANELSLVLDEISPLHDPVQYLDKWRSGKLMQSYEAVEPWCQLIIEKLNPVFQLGDHRGVSMLFPMEKLFESYVAAILKRKFGSNLKTQISSKYLVQHKSNSESNSVSMFQLKPDLLLVTPSGKYVMDTKWKLLDERASGSDVDGKYKISQSDLYQLFAYGHKYQCGKGHMMLIYPKHENFNLPLPVFSYSNELHLWVVPFDLENDVLVDGEWSDAMPEFSLNPVSRAAS